MSLKLYMDVHVQRAVTSGLRLRGVDVVTAQEDGGQQLSDPELLDRATALGSVLFSQDQDLLQEASLRQQRGQQFAGVIYVHQLRLTVGQIIADLDLIAKVYEPVDIVNLVEYLPL